MSQTLLEKPLVERPRVSLTDSILLGYMIEIGKYDVRERGTLTDTLSAIPTAAFTVELLNPDRPHMKVQASKEEVVARAKLFFKQAGFSVDTTLDENSQAYGLTHLIIASRRERKLVIILTEGNFLSLNTFPL